MIEFALFQPDIPQNLGAALRLSSCLGTPLHIIEPCGFPLDDRRIKRAGMDYIDSVNWHRHNHWDAFLDDARSRKKRLILLTTKTNTAYTDHNFTGDELLLLGRESAGVPDHVVKECDIPLTIPMHGQARSLNVTHAAAMVLGEALRQALHAQS